MGPDASGASVSQVSPSDSRLQKRLFSEVDLSEADLQRRLEQVKLSVELLSPTETQGRFIDRRV